MARVSSTKPGCVVHECIAGLRAAADAEPARSRADCGRPEGAQRAAQGQNREGEEGDPRAQEEVEIHTYVQ